MGKALEEIQDLISLIERRQEKGVHGSEKSEILLTLQGQKAVVIALEDIAKAIRER